MAFTSDAIIANIESRLGDGGDHVWHFYKMAYGAPWCSGEVSYTFNKTGNKARWYGGRPVFYVPYAQEWMAKHWETVYDYRRGGDLSKVKKGDVVIFMWKRGSRDHIGFARAAGEAGQLFTVEGNTNGGKVAKRTRAKKYIFAVYRPPYQSPARPKKTAQKQKQSVQKLPSFKKGGTYTTQVADLNIRTGPGTGYARKARKDLTADGQRHADAEGQLKKGTKVTCLETKKNGNQIWMRIPSGWVCAYNGSKQYIK